MEIERKVDFTEPVAMTVLPCRSSLRLLHDNWSFRRVGDRQWSSASVPGCNFTDLLSNQQIADPFYRDNEKLLQWIEQEDWEYRTRFDLTDADLDGEAELVFEGLDTYATVILNGHVLLDADNMFRIYRLQCREKLRSGSNELNVVFRSPIREAFPKYRKNGFVYPAENDNSEENLSVYTRKAPYHFGWDWGPRFVTSGIWRPAYLNLFGCARIADVHCIVRSLSDEKADLSFVVTLDAVQPFSGELILKCGGVAGLLQATSVSPASGRHSCRVDITVPEPRRWWPNGLGEPYLYHFDVLLADDEGILDRRTQRVGLRTIEVVNTPDEHGQCFYLKVNGRPVFMKGANYIPSDSFLDRVSADKYRRIFADAAAANMNMLRVWGGGVYEQDAFYDLADEYGILIWQDFMFACSLYPGDERFLNSVSAEATDTIKRLRNHACLALWCGNNEIEMGMECWSWPKKFDYSNELFDRLKGDYTTLFKELLPKLIAEHDGERFYLSSSPIGFWERPQEDGKGNSHYWGVWHGGEDFAEYRRRIPRFMSEYGFQSFPLLDSVDRYSLPEDRNISSEVMTVHQRHPRGNQLIHDYMKKNFREPRHFEHFLYLSQVQQAEGLRIAFEAHRGAMPYCMGTLYWQLNDCWPVASWSSIDYYGRWKALHYQARRSFAPTAVFVAEQGDDVEIRVVSDARDSQHCDLDIRLLDFDGKLLWQQGSSECVPPNTAATLCRLPAAELLAAHDPREVVLAVSLLNGRTPICDSLHYFVPTQLLALHKPNIDWTVAVQAGRYIVQLHTDTLVKHLHVSVEGVPASVNFSDNFFDLLPGRSRQISLPIEEPAGNFNVKLLSVFDTFDDSSD